MSSAARWLRQSLRMGLVAAAAGTLCATAQAQSADVSAAAGPVFTQPFPQPSDLTPLSPTDVTVDLANSAPQPGSIFPSLAFPGREAYVKFRKDLNQDHGIQLSAFYSQLYQHASETLPGASYDSANGYWAGLLFRWTALNRGGDHEGSLVVNLGMRNSIGNNAVPAGFGVPRLGAAWSNYEFTSWDTNSPKVEDLFWEQWLGKDFNFRIGNQIPTAVYNFSRFKDARVSFTSSPFAFHEIIPYPTFGLGASFRWRPLGQESELYVVGTINDMNGEPAANGLDWSTAFQEHQYFYGTEIGYRWRQPNGEFDHVHLDLFHADRRSTRNAATTPNKAGDGFRVYGEKQMGPYVAFGGYTYNTAEGGGISATVTRQLVTAGLAYLNPLNVRGELALGLMWAQPINNIFPGSGQRNQTGWEAYWRMLVTPNLWVTPGLQVVYNPSFNPGVNTVYIPSFKFRLSF